MTTARIPFTQDDEGAIRTLVGTMLFLLILNFAFGGLGILGGCLSFVGVPGRMLMHPMAGVAALLTAFSLTLYCVGMVGQGVLLVQTRRALEQVVATDTQDQALLGEAFSRLRLFFLLEAVMFVLSILLQCGGLLTQAFGPIGQLHQLGGGL
jgi:hypothetical protein